MRSFSFGVAFRILTGLIAITGLTMATSVVAVSLFQHFQDGFSQLATSKLPGLVSAAQLAQHSGTIAANAPALVMVPDQSAREAAKERIDDQIHQLEVMIADLQQLDSAAAELAGLYQLKSDLSVSLQWLNDLVGRHRAAQSGSDRNVARLTGLADRIRRTVTPLAADGDGAPTPALQPPALLLWTDTANRALTVALAALRADHGSRVEQRRREFSQAIRDAAAHLAELPPALASALAPLHQELAGFDAAETSLFANRIAELQLLGAIRGAVNRNQLVADRLVAVAADYFLAIQQDMERRSARFAREIMRGASLIIALAGLSVLGALAIVFYIDRKVVRRLRGLQTAMATYVQGERAVIDTAGSDEIADMARSLQFFVSAIAGREADLRAANDAAKRTLAELRQAQRHLVESEKMAALGGLVAGFAHEINTPIGTALTAASHLAGCTETFRERMASGALRRSEAQSFVNLGVEANTIICGNLTRAADLIQSFKLVAVDQASHERRHFDLKGYIDEVLMSLTPRLRKAQHQVEVACPEGIRLHGYPGALSQVLTNFVVNALAHAFPDDAPPGLIAITVTGPDAEGVELCFRDNGKGIPARNLPRIFDPFFTTRRAKGGTGLGLHVVYNIVTHQLGGSIRCESAEGQGTTFIVRLPLEAPVIAERAAVA